MAIDTFSPATAEVAGDTGPRLPEAGGWMGWDGRRAWAPNSAMVASVEAPTASAAIDTRLVMNRMNRRELMRADSLMPMS